MLISETFSIKVGIYFERLGNNHTASVIRD